MPILESKSNHTLPSFIKWAEYLADEPLGSVWSEWNNPLAMYYRTIYGCYVEFVGCVIVTKSVDGTDYIMPPRWARILLIELRSQAMEESGTDRLTPMEVIVVARKVLDMTEFLDSLLESG